MGVIAVDEDGKVWGASSRLIHSMLEYFVRSAGEKEYLVNFLLSFEHGYNSIDLREIDTNQLVEFQKLVEKYISSREFEVYGNNEADRLAIANNLSKLVDMIEGSLERRGLSSD